MEIKTVKDYYERLYEKYPTVPKKDIQKILSIGWKTYYLYNSQGGDVLIKDGGKFWCYTGNFTRDSIKYFHYYLNKLAIKIRILYKRLRTEWDGYYYFALSQKQYEETFGTIKPRGRKRKNFIFKNIFLYKILDECKLRNRVGRYIFRIPYISDFGFRKYVQTLKTGKAELIITRDPIKFQDVLVNNNKYDVL